MMNGTETAISRNDDWTEALRSIGPHARTPYKELISSGIVGRPLNFPAPRVYRVSRTQVTACDPKKGKLVKLKNVLILNESKYNQSDHPHSRSQGLNQNSIYNSNHASTDISNNYSLSQNAYFLRKRIGSTVYGYIYKGVILRKRPIFSRELAMLRSMRECSDSNHSHNISSNKSTASSLQCIIEQNDDTDTEYDHDINNLDTSFSQSCSMSVSDITLQRSGDSFDSLSSLSKFEDDAIEHEIWEPTGEYVVIKASSWSKIRNLRGKHLEDPIKEVQAMQLLGDYHPHIIRNIHALQDDDYLYNITPYCKDGDLYGIVINKIHDGGRFVEADARFWFRQLLMALHHLQRKGVCHRDISLDNIMVDGNKCKIIDFGLALRIPYYNAANKLCPTDVSDGTVRLLMETQGQGGSWTYMAPEVVSREDIFDGFAIDLWAIGIILYTMLTGHQPFKYANLADERFASLCERGQLRENLDYCNISLSNEACDLLQNMLWRDPSKRLTLAQVLEHSWVNINDETKESERDDCSRSVHSHSSRRSTVKRW